jgi:hypothetical protein
VSSDTTFIPKTLKRQLGVKGGRNPQLGQDIQQVAVVADLSQTVAPQIFEARATCGGTFSTSVRINGAAPFVWSGVIMGELLSRGAGGMLVEDIRLETIQLGGNPIDSAFPEGVWFMNRRQLLETGGAGVNEFPAPHGGGAPGTTADCGLLAIGGLPPLSVMQIRDNSGFDLAPPNHGVNNTPIELVLPNPFVFNPALQWYVPAGFSLFFWPNSYAQGNDTPTGTEVIVTMSVTWRDYADGPGAQ